VGVGRVGFWCVCLQVVLVRDVTSESALGLLRYVSAPYLFALLTLFPLFGYWFAIVFSINLFQNCFVGLKESTSLWVGIPVEVKLPTAGSPQTPHKRDPHWEVVLLLLLVLVWSHIRVSCCASGRTWVASMWFAISWLNNWLTSSSFHHFPSKSNNSLVFWFCHCSACSWFWNVRGLFWQPFIHSNHEAIAFSYHSS